MNLRAHESHVTMRNQWAGEPFNSSDQEITEALLDVSIPTLMLSLVHITGNAQLLRGPLRPAGLFLNEVQGFMSEEDKQAVRDLALPIIRAYRDRGALNRLRSQATSFWR